MTYDLCTILYADDTSVVANDKNLDKFLETLNDELNKLSIWLNANKLSLNINKHIISFSTEIG